MESAADVGNDHRDPQSVRVSYIALIGVVIGNTLTFVWCAMLAWAIYFMPFICSAPALTIAGWYKSIYCLWAP
nr:Uncharacterised protein [Klebsiella pneumoniae]